jgi:hypothetical protein
MRAAIKLFLAGALGPADRVHDAPKETSREASKATPRRRTSR